MRCSSLHQIEMKYFAVHESLGLLTKLFRWKRCFQTHPDFCLAQTNLAFYNAFEFVSKSYKDEEWPKLGLEIMIIHDIDILFK